MPGRPEFVERAEALEDDRFSREAEQIEAREQELKAAGVMPWWPHRVPGMSAHVWLDELGKRQRATSNSYVGDRTWRPR